MFRTKQEAIDFIYESYLKAQPYQKYSAPDSKKRNPGLTKKLLEDLSFGTNIVVTGSKGKGSVSHMLSLVLQSQGRKTGLVTSPHITDFCERIRVDKMRIPDEKLVELANKLEGEIREIQTKQGEYVSPVGIILALAFCWFCEEGTDLHVLECGKGVRYDDTRNVTHDFGVVLPIFAEHTRELGKTIEDIARDKSRVIQPGQKSVFLAEQPESVRRIFLERARECDVEVRQYGKDFFSENIDFTEEGMKFDVVTEKKRYSDIKIPLLGTHQGENCALSLALGEEICGDLRENEMKEFLQTIDYPGRMELIDRNPITLLDACINRQTVPMVKEVISRIPHRKLAVILAIPEDKDYIGVASLMKEAVDIMVFTSTGNHHYHFSENQAIKAREELGEILYVEGAKNALACAKKQGADCICILGTTSLITELKSC
ncbi:MAG: Mur ligase family protein [Roseburia sp.]|nr:Mur ligase family protein [Roseburia sp.]